MQSIKQAYSCISSSRWCSAVKHTQKRQQISCTYRHVSWGIWRSELRGGAASAPHHTTLSRYIRTVCTRKINLDIPYVLGQSGVGKCDWSGDTGHVYRMERVWAWFAIRRETRIRRVLGEAKQSLAECKRLVWERLSWGTYVEIRTNHGK